MNASRANDESMDFCFRFIDCTTFDTNTLTHAARIHNWQLHRVLHTSSNAAHQIATYCTHCNFYSFRIQLNNLFCLLSGGVCCIRVLCWRCLCIWVTACGKLKTVDLLDIGPSAQRTRRWILRTGMFHRAACKASIPIEYAMCGEHTDTQLSSLFRLRFLFATGWRCRTLNNSLPRCRASESSKSLGHHTDRPQKNEFVPICI